MADLNGFNAEEVSPASDFEPIPAGEYLAMMIDSEMKDTAAKNGKYLNCTFEILDESHKGRRLWDRLNLINQNETAVKIAQSTLSAICHAVGVMRPKDSVELHGKPVKIKVVLEARKDSPGQFDNRIKGYSSVGSVAQKASPSSGEKKTPPWKK